MISSKTVSDKIKIQYFVVHNILLVQNLKTLRIQDLKLQKNVQLPAFFPFLLLLLLQNTTE